VVSTTLPLLRVRARYQYRKMALAITVTPAPAETPAITASGTFAAELDGGALRDGDTVAVADRVGDTVGDGVEVDGRSKVCLNWTNVQDDELHTTHVQHGVMIHVGEFFTASIKLASLMYE